MTASQTIKLTIIFTLTFLFACRESINKNEADKTEKRIVIYLDADSTGNISNPEARQQLAELGMRVSKNADRIMLHSYTEKCNTSEEANSLGAAQARIAKDFMFNIYHERIFYNVGVTIHGFDKPINISEPESLKNRRIEVELM